MAKDNQGLESANYPERRATVSNGREVEGSSSSNRLLLLDGLSERQVQAGGRLDPGVFSFTGIEISQKLAGPFLEQV